MKKALRITVICAGVISIIAAIVLTCIYLEDISGSLKALKGKLLKKLPEKTIEE